MLRWLWLSVVVLVIDQVTKWLAVKHLLGKPPYKILPVFDLHIVLNTGAAFGMLNDASGWQTNFFIGVAVVVGSALVYALSRLNRLEVQAAAAFALIIGGAFGNVIDRLRQGYVIDFIHWFYNDWHWPTFNIADSAITVGAIILVLDTIGLRIFGPRKHEPDGD